MPTSPKRTRAKKTKIVSDAEIKKSVEILKDSYSLFVSIGDTEMDFETDDIVGTLLDIKPAKVLQRVTFILKKDDKSAMQTLFPFRAKRIFGNRYAAEFFAKRLLILMK